MRESRWRSMSIMDLNLTRRKSSGAGTTASGSVSGSLAGSLAAPPATGQQSNYELIQSTQSLVDRLHLNAEDITIQPVHPSIIGQDTWFQITYVSSGTTRYFSCQSPRERDEWIASLRRTLALSAAASGASSASPEDRRRTDCSLKLGVLEAKGLREKKRYYVEVLVDDKLFARTATKRMGQGMCFWGENFEFKDLPARTERISFLIHKDKGGSGGGNGFSSNVGSNLNVRGVGVGSNNAGVGKRKRKKAKKPVGRVRVAVPSVQSRYMQEKWHPVEKSSRRESPSLRLKCQFQAVDVLPLREYEPLVYFLRDEYRDLVRMLEPALPVRVKEELASELMRVFHAEDVAEDVLADLVADEVSPSVTASTGSASSSSNDHLTFRGNSVATKAMEAYLKLVGARYLQATLQPVVGEVVAGSDEVDLEVDPIKVADPDRLQQNRANLRTVVKQVWSRVSGSHSYFPPQLQRCLHKIRQYLEHVGRPEETGDKLVSSCVFLRFLCPAVLSPSLFGLADEFPGERANRNLTLVAKTLQTLANFTRYEGADNPMAFLNTFLEEESAPMRAFLRQISSPVPEDQWIPDLGNNSASCLVDRAALGRHLSCLHTILFENISKIPNSESDAKAAKLRDILDDLNHLLHRPTMPQLEQISQPTLTTLRQIQQQQEDTASASKVDAATTSSSSSKFSWSWTLPKKSKNSNSANAAPPVNLLSHPAPHHEAAPRHHFLPTSTVTMVSSEDTSCSSAASLTPSPGGSQKDPPSLGRWPPRMPSTSSSAIAIHQTSSSPAHRQSVSGAVGVPIRPKMSSPSSKSSAALFPGAGGSSFSLERAGVVGAAGDMTDSSDDSTYSSQYHSSDANSTPRCGAANASSSSGQHHSQTLPRPLTGGGHGYSTHNRHRAVQRGYHVSSSSSPHHHHNTSSSSAASNGGHHGHRSLSEYEREIMELRSAMETLQIKLGEAERKLEEKKQKKGPPSAVARNLSTEEEDEEEDDYDEEKVKETVRRLATEEDRLRREQVVVSTPSKDNAACVGEKERMVLMQQRKVASLDGANARLTAELGRLTSSGSQVIQVRSPPQHQNLAQVQQQQQQQDQQQQPRTVDELLDSLHSTPI